MEIKIDDRTLNEYVEKAINYKIESLTDEIIKDRVYDALFGKVDGIFAAYKHDIKHLIEKHVRAYIKETCPVIDKEMFKDVGRSIANSIAYELREDVLTSIAYRLMPDETEEDDDEY